MQRTTIMLPPNLKRQASRLARDRGLSLGELIRDSLEKRLAEAVGTGRDSLFADHLTFSDNGPSDVAANVDKYLAEADTEENRREQSR